MFIKNGKIKFLFKVQLFILFTSLFSLLSDPSDGQIASVEIGHAHVRLLALFKRERIQPGHVSFLATFIAYTSAMAEVEVVIRKTTSS